MTENCQVGQSLFKTEFSVQFKIISTTALKKLIPNGLARCANECFIEFGKLRSTKNYYDLKRLFFVIIVSKTSHVWKKIEVSFK